MNIDIGSLYRFSANSTGDLQNIDLWIKGASLFIDQLNSLLKNMNYQPIIYSIETFNNENMNFLKEILDKNKSDKASSHNYHILYSYILNKLGKEILDILEIGLGTNNPTLISTMGECGNPGASLYSWNEYLPNSNIYGADIDKDILFETDRIKTSYVDQLNFTTFNEMQKKFGNKNYDLIIDDGLHSIGANLNTLLFALGNIKMNGWIVIEDMMIIDNWFVIDYILSNDKRYKSYLIKSKSAYLYVINKINI